MFVGEYVCVLLFIDFSIVNLQKAVANSKFKYNFCMCICLFLHLLNCIHFFGFMFMCWFLLLLFCFVALWKQNLSFDYNIQRVPSMHWVHLILSSWQSHCVGYQSQSSNASFFHGFGWYFVLWIVLHLSQNTWHTLTKWR